MRVMVTGGAGFIGSHTVEALLEAGSEVVVYDNFSAGKRDNLPSSAKLRIVEGDIRDRAALLRAVEGCTHVLNLAAQVSVVASVADPGASAHHNVVGFANVLDCARIAGVSRVVFASSAAVYGDPAETPLQEESVTRPLSPYGLDKLTNEHQAALFERLYGMSTLALRYFNVYGPRQDPSSPYAGVISRFANRIATGEPLTVFGDGRQTRDFIFVRDIARVNALALAGSETGVCNVGTGVSVTLLQLIDALAACAGRTPAVEFGPPAAGDIRESAMEPRKLHAWFGLPEATPLAEGLASLVGAQG